MPSNTVGAVVRPGVLDAINHMVLDIARRYGSGVVVSVGLRPGNLVRGEPVTVATPVGLVHLFEDDGQ